MKLKRYGDWLERQKNADLTVLIVMLLKPIRRIAIMYTVNATKQTNIKTLFRTKINVFSFALFLYLQQRKWQYKQSKFMHRQKLYRYKNIRITEVFLLKNKKKF